MPWIEPKLNWNKNDYLNYTDMNRVENNTQVVKTSLEQLQGPVEIDEIVTNRDVFSIDFDNDLNRVESNIAALADFFCEPLGWQTPKTDWQGNISSFSYLDIIRMELNLKLLYELILKTMDALPYCGEYYCGEDVI